MRWIGEKVCIYGDYDVDGITSVFDAATKSCRGRCLLLYPWQEEEGYDQCPGCP